MLDLMEQQFVGYVFYKWNGDNVVGLIESAGLTKDEWAKYKREYSGTLDHNDIDAIDDYFQHNLKPNIAEIPIINPELHSITGVDVVHSVTDCG